jgi:hypothetical protein
MFRNYGIPSKIVQLIKQFYTNFSASIILDIKTMQKILLGMDSKVIPLQLLQLVKSPDFGILMMLPSDQLLGIITFFHILWNTGCKVSAARTGSILKSSAFSWSVPGAFSWC